MALKENQKIFDRKFIDFIDQRSSIGMEEFEIDEQSPESSPRFKRFRLTFGCIGLICILIAILSTIVGSSRLVDYDRMSRDDNSFAKNRSKTYLENHFSLIILLFSGIDSVYKVKYANYEKSTFLLVTLFLAFGYSTCACVSQFVNLMYSYGSRSVRNAILLLLYDIVVASTCLCQITLLCKLAAYTRRAAQLFGSSGEVVVFEASHLSPSKKSSIMSRTMFSRNSFILVFGLVQICCAITVGVLLVKIESEFERSLKISDEIGCSAWLIVSSALCLIWASLVSKFSSLFKAAAILKALAVISSIRFLCVPLEMLYVFWNQNESDAKLSLGMFILGLELYVSLLFCLLAYIKSAYKFDHLLINALSGFVSRDWPVYRCTPVIQLFILFANISLLIIGFNKGYLFATDFTPLTFLLFCHTVFSLQLYRTPTPQLMLVNFMWSTLCGLFAFRDIYLFNYHVAKSSRTPDIALLESEKAVRNATTINRLKTGINVGLVVTALLELMICLSLSATYVRTALDYLIFVFDRHLYGRRRFRLFYITGACQLICALLLLNFGFVTFLSNSYTAEMFGDHSMYVSILCIIAGTTTVLCGKYYDVVPFAVIMQILSTFLITQFLDYGSYCLNAMLTQKYLQPDFQVPRDVFGRQASQNAISIATASYGLLIVEIVLGGTNLMLMYGIVENGEYRLKPQSTILSTMKSAAG